MTTQHTTELKSNASSKKTQYILESKFQITERLGSGSFGTIYKGIIADSEEAVAIKFEKDTNDNSRMLAREVKILKDLTKIEGFPDFISYGKQDNYYYLVMTLLGSNLENLVRKYSNHFSLKTVTMMGKQIIERLEVMHSKNYLHRDIKPENFLIGIGENAKTIYLIDFGLSKKYRDENGNHIPYRDKKGLVGTARYASINSHLGIEQCRRDDLEAVGYLLIYFLKGNLPWQNLQIENKNEKFRKILEIKKNTPTDILCKDTPKEFAYYLDYVKKLGFEDKPDYEFLKGLFVNVMKKNHFEMDNDFDWVNKKKIKIDKKIPILKETNESNYNPSIDEEVKINEAYITKARKIVGDKIIDSESFVVITHYHLHQTPKNFVAKTAQHFNYKKQTL